MHPLRHRFARQLLIYGGISILIGIVFLSALAPKLLLDPMAFLRNAGYSLMLGIGLFLSGKIFSGVESRYVSWLKRPLKSLMVTLLLSLLCSSSVIFFTNWFWYVWMMGIQWEDLWRWNSSVIAYEYVVFYAITLFMFAKSFFTEWKLNVTEKERLSREALALQYETLSNQVNPHFLFNSLNVLLSLIDYDTDAAKKFTRQLAAFYRQLLLLKDQQTIPLAQELDLARNYLDLLQIRFRNALTVTFDCPHAEPYSIIPLTLQLLVENAMKHNIIGNDSPMHLEIRQAGNRLAVRNTLQRKTFVSDPSGIGLKNLHERFLFFTDQHLKVTETTDLFEVQIPLIEPQA
ncbi:MAG: histidine kinase [Breznakibacter sp.]